VLELTDVVKHYHVGDGPPVRAVDGVSMSIAPGEFVALFGPSGSGKSTLLMLAAGLLVPDSGSVRYQSRELAEMTESERSDYLRDSVGLVGQAAHLLPGALAIENASLKLWQTHPRGAEAKVTPLLVRLGLGHRLRHRTDQLSLGERHRVVLAQALSTDPSLVLADEPTGNLNSYRTNEILLLLREICLERGTSVLLVTHDPHAVAFADRAHELRDGKLESYVAPNAALPVPPGSG
jgi:putative ABC transport system ATP-binding protein